MLSRRLLNTPLRAVTIFRNLQTYVHPVSQLGTELQSQLQSEDKKKTNTSAVYSTFKESIETLSDQLPDPTALRRSFGLNAPLSTLLQRSAAEEGAQTDPYQILNTMCQHQVARAPHFEIVLTYLLKQGLCQDAIALWVKYLECLAENPYTLSQSSSNRAANQASHETNVALATLAYAMLPQSAPDVKVLTQILQLDEARGQAVPFGRAKFLASKVLSTKDSSRSVEQALASLFRQHVSSNKPSFLEQLDTTLQPRHLKDLYEAYHSVRSTGDDPEILAKFMQRFVALKRPLEAITVYNQHKKLDSALLKNGLLQAVAALQSNNATVRLDRVLAVWNSVVKAAAENQGKEGPGPDAYAALLGALDISGNIAQLQSIWLNEIPEAVKQEPRVRERYLIAMINNDKTSYKAVAAKLPKQIQSVELADAVLLQMARDRVPEQELDTFYQSQFGQPPAKKPTILTLAVRMWANWQFASGKAGFEFFKSIAKSPHDSLRSNAILEEFIRIVPSVKPIRELLPQIKEPLDSRKYGQFITAEFVKQDGDYKVAEQIFKDYLEDCKDRLNKVDRFVLEPLIIGFCECAISENDVSFLSKVELYCELASKLKLQLSNQALAKTLHAVARLTRSVDNKFQPQEKQFVEQFLQKLSQVKGFNANPRDMEQLRNSNVSVPPQLL